MNMNTYCHREEVKKKKKKYHQELSFSFSGFVINAVGIECIGTSVYFFGGKNLKQKLTRAL